MGGETFFLEALLFYCLPTSWLIMNTREQILDASEQLARSRGFDAFSYADLAERVGIRKASIHHHFAKKANLGQALMARYRAHFLEALTDLAAKEPSAGPRLLGYLDLYRAALSGGQTLCLCVAFSAGRDSLTEPTLRELDLFHQQSLAWLEQTFTAAALDGSIAQLGELQSEAAATLALVEGAQLMARAAASLEPFDQAVSALRQRAD